MVRDGRKRKGRKSTQEATTSGEKSKTSGTHGQLARRNTTRPSPTTDSDQIGRRKKNTEKTTDEILVTIGKHNPKANQQIQDGISRQLTVITPPPPPTEATNERTKS